MQVNNFIQTLVAIMGVLMSLSYFPQSYKLWKNKNADNISLIFFSIFSLGTAVWTAYGLYLHNYVIISSFAVSTLGSWSILIQAIIYKRRARTT